MLLIFGTKRYVDHLGQPTATCPRCGNVAAQRVERWTTKFSVFFVPLFTVRQRHVVQCAWCGAQSDLSEHEARSLLGAAA